MLRAFLCVFGHWPVREQRVILRGVPHEAMLVGEAGRIIFQGSVWHRTRCRMCGETLADEELVWTVGHTAPVTVTFLEATEYCDTGRIIRPWERV